MKKLRLILMALAGCTAITACYKDNAEDMYPTSDCDLTAVTYASTIKPIMEASCATPGCHADARTTGYDLSNYAGVAAVANNGKLLEAVKQTGPSPMPQGGAKLDDCTISKIETWVNDGAPDN